MHGQRTSGRSRTSLLPPGVRVRLVAHEVDRASISTAPATGDGGLFEMRPDAQGPGQLHRYSKALRTALRAFPGSGVERAIAPSGDTDPSWRVIFRFSRTPQEESWDTSLFEAGAVLLRSVEMKSRNRMCTADSQHLSAMWRAAETLALAYAVTADPAISAGRSLLLSLYAETPDGIRRGQRGVSRMPLTTDDAREVARKASAVLLDMLDTGTDPRSARPRIPGDPEGLRDLEDMFRARTACLMALALKEGGRLPSARDSIAQDIVGGIRVFGTLHEETGEPVYLAAADSLRSLMAETPFGRRWCANYQISMAPIGLAEAEETLIAAVDAISEEMVGRFPCQERGDGLEMEPANTDQQDSACSNTSHRP